MEASVWLMFQCIVAISRAARLVRFSSLAKSAGL
jgi:hypothetical protein